MKIKFISKKHIFSLISNFVLVFSLLSFLLIIRRETPSVISASDFTQYMKEQGCDIIDVQEQANYPGVDTYLNVSQSCPYLASYLVFHDEAQQEMFFSTLKKEVLSAPSFQFFTYTEVRFPSYQEYSITSNQYKMITQNQNSILFAFGDIEDKTTILSLFQQFNYHYTGNIFYLLGIFILTFLLIFLVSFWKIEKKIRDKGWIVLIPFYNIGCLTKDIFGSTWHVLFLFIPIINIFFILTFLYKLGKVFNKSSYYCIGLMLLPTIFLPLLAFDDSKYNIDRGQNETKYN